MNHQNIVKVYQAGHDGEMTFPDNGPLSTGVSFMIMEYVQGKLLYDICDQFGALGEKVGRFFINQIFNTLQYIHKQNVAHRDIKLDNIMVDQNMNIKFIDFGFAARGDIYSLKDMYGTKSYLAPEIRKGLVYDGTKIDTFSTGVVLYLLVRGIFPF